MNAEREGSRLLSRPELERVQRVNANPRVQYLLV
jgi:hypothetical protein